MPSKKELAATNGEIENLKALIEAKEKEIKALKTCRISAETCQISGQRNRSPEPRNRRTDQVEEGSTVFG
jgi:hypothetical protein